MEALVDKYSKKVDSLRNSKVVVRPIRRQGGWVGMDHDSSFMNDGASIGIVVPQMESGYLVDPLTFIKGEFDDKDREFLAKELGLQDISPLNTYVKKNYWVGNTVLLDRNGLYLDLSKIPDFVKFLILRSDSERIAPTWGERFEKGTYKFAICEEGVEIQDKVSNLEEKKMAYAHLGKIDTNNEKMLDFLYVYYLTKKDSKRPPRTADSKWLKNEIGRIIEDDIKMFLSILEDENYNLKLLIQRSVEVGAIKRDKHEYTFPGADRPVGVMEDLIAYLDDPKNQDVKVKLLNLVETTTVK